MENTSFLPLTLSKIRSRNRAAQLVILLSFLITFVIVRAITTLQFLGILPNQEGVFHLHHLVPGIIFVLVSGYVGISFWNNGRVRFVVSVLFGIGAALTIDEFALWLFLKDVYWEEQGRRSVDAAVVVTILLTIVFVISEVHDHVFLKRLVGKRQS